MFVQKPNGRFYFFIFNGVQGWVGQTSLQLSQAQIASFFPTCTYSIIPLAGPEQAGAQCNHTEKGREGNLVQNPSMYKCG